MEVKEYIESGILELYVYGLLTEAENEEVFAMANKHPEINDEIIAIEKVVVNLSSSFSLLNSLKNYEILKALLELKVTPPPAIIKIEPARNWTKFIGWAAAVLLLIAIVSQYNQLELVNNKVVNAETEKEKIVKELNELKLEKEAVENNLAIIRDKKNTVVNLGGQAVSPESSAKVYWNKEKETVFVDASGLPEPPEGMVYQVWSLKLDPLTPTSIGLLDNFKDNTQRFFAVEKTGDAEAFGITLEPAGGSLTPTMEQLYTLGKV